MRNILIITSCAILLCFTTIAYGADGPYISGNVGYVLPSNADYTNGAAQTVVSDGGFAILGAVGFSSGEARGEVEVGFQKNGLDKIKPNPSLTGDITSLSVLANGYYDISTGGSFTPFLSVGLGFATLELDDAVLAPAGNEDDTVFAYQFGGGVGYAVDDQVSIEIKYRFFATSDPEFGTTNAEYSSHNFLAGLRYSF